MKKAPARRVFSSRVVMGAADVTDSKGHVWRHRTTGVGSWRTGVIPPGVDVARTRDDALYRRTAPGISWYRLEVPAAATYRVRLLFSENWFTRSGERVFDVTAEGRRVARDVDVVKAVGKNAARDVTFTVPVRDGRLDLGFVAKKDLPILSGVEVVSTTPVAVTAAPSPKVPLARNSAFFTDIRTAPLAPNSARAAAGLTKQVRDNWGGVAAFNARRFNNSFYEVPATQRKVRVNFYDCQRKGYTPAGLFDGPKHFVDVPIPPNAVPATGSDKQLTVYDRTADKLWDFWVTEKRPDGSWRACWGGRIDDVSRSQGVFPRPYGASASGLAMTPGVISIDEFRRGRVDHAMYLALIDVAKWDRYSWPANRSDGLSNDPDAIMEGQRLRLDPTLDLSTIPMTPVARMVAEAAQKYGFVVADKAGAVAVATESGNAEKARTGVDPWNGLLAGPDYQAMQGFPWEHIQVLPKDYGKPTR
ncbi:malectin domain-containing carbohydrate-binding protein [Mobilicoccus pelagius]|uniref:malectin domain-containing carbohydrate-binding protein n=1 Tax=Mobilicoccus pelagius TaxID=746032 RepID=UPI0003152E80|nr:malectin domain-containing carbohydrate-binding protein [Mobilicoccus pelagius]